jgi:hypothetical protein
MAILAYCITLPAFVYVYSIIGVTEGYFCEGKCSCRPINSGSVLEAKDRYCVLES